MWGPNEWLTMKYLFEIKTDFEYKLSKLMASPGLEVGDG